MRDDTTTSMIRRRAVAATLLGAVAATTVAAATTATAAAQQRPGDSQLAQVRAATARFHDVAVATAEGYVPAGQCEEVPGLGVMGVHYVNPALVEDAVVDPARPEILLYLPTGNGLRLVGVEWFVAEAASGGTHPEILGVPFDGPMAGHAPGMPEHYDLHAWVWAHNPVGMFHAWNPSLSCGAQS